MEEDRPAVVCWGCGRLLPIEFAVIRDGERLLPCPNCGAINALDRPPTGPRTGDDKGPD
jgi:predicted RNA-binding Zn-ribbon protein involved in translation (DUF1610 family)